MSNVGNSSTVVRERFELEPFARWLLLAGPWIFGAMALFGLALPFLPDNDRPADPIGIRVLGILCTFGFGVAAWYSAKVVSRLHSYAVQVDEDGLWPAFRSKAVALVRWSEITSVRERHFLQCLDLFDNGGERVMRLEYQLRGFQRLRDLVRQRAGLRPVVTRRRVFRKTFWHHLFNLAGISLSVALGLYLSQERPLFGYASAAGLGALLGWEYARTASKVSIAPGRLTIVWPGRSLTLRPDDVRAIELSDSFADQSRLPQVTMSLLGRRRQVHLRKLGATAFELHQVLSAWKNGVA